MKIRHLLAFYYTCHILFAISCLQFVSVIIGSNCTFFLKPKSTTIFNFHSVIYFICNIFIDEIKGKTLVNNYILQIFFSYEFILVNRFKVSRFQAKQLSDLSLQCKTLEVSYCIVGLFSHGGIIDDEMVRFTL